MAYSDLDSLEAELDGRVPLQRSLLLLAIFATIAAALIWAFLARVDDVTRASGRIVPAGDLQQITATDAGVISKVFVSEGDLVDAGAPLVELDSLVQSSQFDREMQRAFALRAQIERLSAEIEDRPLSFGPELEARAPEIVASQRALYLAREQEHASNIAVLMRRMDQNERERAEVLSDLTAALRISDLLAEQRQIIAPLVEAGVEPRLSLIDLMRQHEEQESRKGRAAAALARLDAAAREIDETIGATRNKFRTDALRSLSEGTADLSSLRPSLPALESLAARTTLRAVERGVVNSLHRRTIGAAVRAGEVLVEIVPIDDDLHVEAYILPQDIGLLRPGQPVRVKLSAFDYTRYGMLDGHIVRIGASAVQLDERDASEVFVAVIRTEGTILDGAGVHVQIIPGMTAEVDILAGERRVVDYLLQPIQRLRDRAFSE